MRSGQISDEKSPVACFLRRSFVAANLYLFCAFVFSNTLLAADIVSVKALRFWQAPDNTRIVLDLSSAPVFEVAVLDNPNRLVVDLKNAKLAIDLASTAVNSNLVLKLREASAAQAGAIRLVFDLNGSVSQKSFALKPFQQYGDRLVIDLSDASKKSTAASESAKSLDSGKASEKRDVIIAVDAGHGGDDPGAIGPKKTEEKDVTLAIAKRLADKINATAGMKAVLTRAGDYFVPLRKRTDIAREKRADLFVSIHADSFKDKTVSGASVWALSQKGAKSEMGRWLEEKENASDLLGGEDSVALAKYDDDVARVLLDLSMYYAVGSSLDVGATVLKEMKDVVPRLHKPKVQQAGFVVLKNPDIPAILVETAFLSNPKEESLLVDQAHQEKLASAILSGVKVYFVSHAPEGSRLAEQRRSRFVVANGDTLVSVAQHFRTSVSALREKNGLDSDALKVGQVLQGP